MDENMPVVFSNMELNVTLLLICSSFTLVFKLYLLILVNLSLKFVLFCMIFSSVGHNLVISPSVVHNFGFVGLKAPKWVCHGGRTIIKIFWGVH